LAVLGGTWGRRGELTGISLTSGPERFAGLERVYLFGEKAGSDPQCLELESVWEHRGQLVFKFRGVDSISDAERLERSEVRVPFSERAPLAGDEYYESDLVGCEVFERASGERLGVVTALEGHGGPPLLAVSSGSAREPLLIPFARAICVEIDVAAKRIAVELPEGLKEINVR
jgi:16S rRNA processing protein RimM